MEARQVGGEEEAAGDNKTKGTPRRMDGVARLWHKVRGGRRETQLFDAERRNTAKSRAEKVVKTFVTILFK